MRRNNVTEVIGFDTLAMRNRCAGVTCLILVPVGESEAAFVEQLAVSRYRHR